MTLFQEIKAYCWPDNRYWTGPRIKSLLKRLPVYSALVLVIFINFSVSTGQAPRKAWQPFRANLEFGIKEIVKDFPTRLIAYARLATLDQENFSQEDLSRILEQRSVKYNIQRLLKASERVDYTEIGGAVMLTEKNELQFYELPSYHTVICQRLIADYQNNPERARKLFLDNKEFFRLFYDPVMFEKIISYIQRGNGKDRLMDSVVARFADDNLMQEYYIWSHDSFMEIFYPGNFPGKFAGTFHIHQSGEPPSREDLENSRSRREFVIAKEQNGYTLYELMNGEIAKEIKKTF